jgi:hypothetical protein
MKAMKRIQGESSRDLLVDSKKGVPDRAGLPDPRLELVADDSGTTQQADHSFAQVCETCRNLCVEEAVLAGANSIMIAVSHRCSLTEASFPFTMINIVNYTVSPLLVIIVAPTPFNPSCRTPIVSDTDCPVWRSLYPELDCLLRAP